jgi:uncharacterized protein
MNIIYLHGLDSKLSEEKKSILQNFGNVITTNVDYYTNANVIQTVLEDYQDSNIDIVMGSSMGGFAGYYVANALKKPALLFNPALVKRSVQQNVPEITEVNTLKQIILGQVDDVVNPHETIDFLMKHLNPVTQLHLHLVPGLGHNIPVAFFENTVAAFFKKLGSK